MVDVSKHPLLTEAYEVMQAIEKCGASPELTEAVTKAGDLLKSIDEAIGPNAITLTTQAGHFNPVQQVYFRAGLIACREHVARVVDAQDPSIAASIRSTWWPQLGDDLGAPRKNEWSEFYEGEYPNGRVRENISPTAEALPVALQFLERPPIEQSPAVKQGDEWVAVSERLPPESGYRGDTVSPVVEFRVIGRYHFPTDSLARLDRVITHWRAAPKTQEALGGDAGAADELATPGAVLRHFDVKP
jgi:hypothetical protein